MVGELRLAVYEENGQFPNGESITMTPAKLRKACDKVGGVCAIARPLGKGHTPQYLYRRINRKVGLDSAGDSLRLRPPTRPSVLPGSSRASRGGGWL